jgi:hypothetical protein
MRSYIFTAIMNSRIVFTALLSTCLMNKSINCEQWRAIIVIFCAVTVLCLEDLQSINPKSSSSQTNESFGMCIALFAAGVSAGGGVLVVKYLSNPTNSPSSSFLSMDKLKAAAEERIITPSLPSTNDTTFATIAPPASAPSGVDESAHTTLWEQQDVLALFSAVFADLYVLVFHLDTVQERKLMQGWTGMTVTTC